MKLINIVSLIKEEDYPEAFHNKISVMRRFVGEIYKQIVFNSEVDLSFPYNICREWKKVSDFTHLPSKIMDWAMEEMIGDKPRSLVQYNEAESFAISNAVDCIENGSQILHPVIQLVYLMWKHGMAFMPTHYDGKYGKYGEVYVAMARFIGRLDCDVNGRQISPVPGDKKAVKLTDYIGSLLGMFEISLDVGTVIEKIKLRQNENDFRYVLVDNGGIKEAYGKCVFKSCMNTDSNNEGKAALDYYDAMSNVKLLVGYKGDKAYSRAIMWGLGDGSFLVDRIYDYNQTMKMEDYINTAVHSQGKTIQVFSNAGEQIEIKLKDARGGGGVASMTGWKLNKERQYGVVCRIPNGIPEHNYSPYFDSVNGIYFPDKYTDKIVCMIGNYGFTKYRTREIYDRMVMKHKHIRVSGSTGSIQSMYYLLDRTGTYIRDTNRLIRINGEIAHRESTIRICVNPDGRTRVFDNTKIQNTTRYLRLLRSDKFREEVVSNLRITDIKRNNISLDRVDIKNNVYAHRDMVVPDESLGGHILKQDACLLLNPKRRSRRSVNIGISGYCNVLMCAIDDVDTDTDTVIKLSDYHRATDDFYYHFPVYAYKEDVVIDKNGVAYLANCIEINSDGLPLLKQKGEYYDRV